MSQITQDLLKKIRRIDIKTRGLTQQVFSGEYHAAFKGKGMSFSEVREYQYGDDIRNIDWNVSARYNHPFVKVFEEERELSVVLLIDVSASNDFGTQLQFKKDLITEIAAVLAYSAIYNNDKVGVIFFSDTIEKFIPPKKGKSHILQIIRELLTIKPQSTKTDLAAALKYLMTVVKKRSIVFVLSDFLDDQYEFQLKIAAKKHDVVALKISDIAESKLTNLGVVPFVDPETGEEIWVDTSKEKLRIGYQACAMENDAKIKDIFHRCGIDYAFLYSHINYIPQLIQLFKKRELR
jgi:uncharacterized protein (DUF58 family)